MRHKCRRTYCQLFTDHPDLEIVTFSESEKAEILDDLNKRDDDMLDDLLFGSMDMFDEEGFRLSEIVKEKDVFEPKDPVFVWDSAWSVDYISEVFENGSPVFFASSPLQYLDNQARLNNWHLQNQSIFGGAVTWRYFTNAKMVQEDFPKLYAALMASIGAVVSSEMTQTWTRKSL